MEPTIILRIKDSSGKVIWEANPKRTQAISAGVAYDVTRILQQNILNGTGTKANINRPAAGKTGTAQDFGDAWFCGYTPHLSTTVWVGHPEGQIPMTNVHGISVTGGSFPAIIWQKFMNVADPDYPEAEFAPPRCSSRTTPSSAARTRRIPRPPPRSARPPPRAARDRPRPTPTTQRTTTTRRPPRLRRARSRLPIAAPDDAPRIVRYPSLLRLFQLRDLTHMSLIIVFFTK